MRLYVNIDHVATVRQARRGLAPDPVAAAEECERSGADGITVHLREDRRHIQLEDVTALAKTVTTVLNLELSIAPEIVEVATGLAPHQATLVPERREEITTEGGLNLRSISGEPDPRIRTAIDRLRAAGIRVSLFIDPDPETIETASVLGATAIELHTGEYANAGGAAPELERLRAAARLARAGGLAVHAGHGLNYENVQPVAAIEEIEELNIGHSIVSRAIFVGMARAVEEMGRLVRDSR